MHAPSARRRPSASLMVSLVALFVALGDSGHAATLANVVLGRTSHSTATTGIAGRLPHQILALTNSGSGPAASFTVRPGSAPFTVNSSKVVPNLDAALLDGSPATAFWGVDGNADTTPSHDYLGTSDNEPLELGADGSPIVSVFPIGEVGIGTVATPTIETTQLDVAASAQDIDGIDGSSSGGEGVVGQSTSNTGVSGTSTTADGVTGQSTSGAGVGGRSVSAAGVSGVSSTADGAEGVSTSGSGVAGASQSGIGVLGVSNARAVVGTIGRVPCPSPTTTGYAVGGCAGSQGPGVYGNGATGVVGVQGPSCATPSAQGEPPSCSDCGGIAAGVTGCAGTDGAGVVGEISHPPGGSTAAAFEAYNDGGGDLFLGFGGGGKRVARIDSNGKAYFDGGTQSSGADYADAFGAADAAKLRPGDVLTIDPRGGVELARSPDSPLLAGVYSTKPAVLGVGDRPAGSALRGRVPVALVGVVPTRVCASDGPVRVGDLLTTSAIPGCAMRATPVVIDGTPIYRAGTILGKALQPLRSGERLVDVLVTLR